MSGNSTIPVSEAIRQARWVDLGEGDKVEGRVCQLPTRGAFAGTRLFLRTRDSEVVSIAATGRRGWTVLENELIKLDVHTGDQVAVTFTGWRKTCDGERQYRTVRVEVLGRAGFSSAEAGR